MFRSRRDLSFLHIDADRYFDDPAARLAPEAQGLYILANPVLPHSEGEIVLQSVDPGVHPSIRMHYYDDPHDLPVMVDDDRRKGRGNDCC